MDQLNYHHLLYFHTVAREGSVSRAGERLHLAQPTISTQIRALERSLGHRLFARRGRGLVLTEMGREVYRLADEIFSIGREVIDLVSGRPVGRPPRLVIGAADLLPKLVVHRLISPALQLPEAVRLLCVEGRTNELLARLAVHELDVVLADTPIPPSAGVAAFNHRLGECPTAILGHPRLAARYRRGFPASLDAAPMLLPTPDSMLRRSFDQYLDSSGIRPLIVGEFEDMALMKTFGETGMGLFPVPDIVRAEVERQFSVRTLGILDQVRESFYVISMERKVKHPAVLAITQAARDRFLRTQRRTGASS